jgi:hypothetical protein
MRNARPEVAGKPRPLGLGGITCLVHPRARGRYRDCRDPGGVPLGPSTCARATRCGCILLFRDKRSIHMRAGDTFHVTVSHPRKQRSIHARTGYMKLRTSHVTPSEVHPRTRDRQPSSRGGVGPSTREGDTLRPVRTITTEEVHPHARGRHSSISARTKKGRGPSTCARATRADDFRALVFARSIHMRAGDTLVDNRLI